ncbi:biopolymer transporter ExbD [Paludibacterium purpuratum]|uniref:Cell division and transport-associated protein TolR n=1 Tax=Paludibacterium purpuratum TaxID=1144873 RepID=A0A4R7B6P6_9NEIS|nr:biopolymer transporter ExbD [Paludibacterium purpuratum]TDR80380.1 cell division and transport-associated protein TolR [Paludibacterium purpuratum]
MLNRRPRRQINQMNVVPYIDVMLVLLVIFMIATPMFSPGVVDVPSVSQARTPDIQPVEVALDTAGTITLRSVDATRTFTSVDELASAAAAMAQSDRPFAISAERNMKYEDVLKVADALHKAGIKRVALTVKQSQ